MPTALVVLMQKRPEQHQRIDHLRGEMVAGCAAVSEVHLRKALSADSLEMGNTPRKLIALDTWRAAL